jgi:hypothetical protein
MLLLYANCLATAAVLQWGKKKCRKRRLSHEFHSIPMLLKCRQKCVLKNSLAKMSLDPPRNDKRKCMCVCKKKLPETNTGQFQKPQTQHMRLVGSGFVDCEGLLCSGSGGQSNLRQIRVHSRQVRVDSVALLGTCPVRMSQTQAARSRCSSNVLTSQVEHPKAGSRFD